MAVPTLTASKKARADPAFCSQATSRRGHTGSRVRTTRSRKPCAQVKGLSCRWILPIVLSLKMYLYMPMQSAGACLRNHCGSNLSNIQSSGPDPWTMDKSRRATGTAYLIWIFLKILGPQLTNLISASVSKISTSLPDRTTTPPSHPSLEEVAPVVPGKLCHQGLSTRSKRSR